MAALRWWLSSACSFRTSKCESHVGGRLRCQIDTCKHAASCSSFDESIGQSAVCTAGVEPWTRTCDVRTGCGSIIDYNDGRVCMTISVMFMHAARRLMSQLTWSMTRRRFVPSLFCKVYGATLAPFFGNCRMGWLEALGVTGPTTPPLPCEPSRMNLACKLRWDFGTLQVRWVFLMFCILSVFAGVLIRVKVSDCRTSSYEEQWWQRWKNPAVKCLKLWKL